MHDTKYKTDGNYLKSLYTFEFDLGYKTDQAAAMRAAANNKSNATNSSVTYPMGYNKHTQAIPAQFPKFSDGSNVINPVY